MAANNDMSRVTMIQKLTARLEQMKVEFRKLQLIHRLTTLVAQMEAELRELQPPQPQQQQQRQQLCLVTALANASPTEQRTILCGNLYPLVEQIEGKAVAKVTDMILQMDVSEVLYLLESPQDLEAKVGQAMEFLQLSKNFSL